MTDQEPFRPTKPIDSGKSWRQEFQKGSRGEKAIESLGLRCDHLRHDLEAFDNRHDDLSAQLAQAIAEVVTLRQEKQNLADAVKRYRGELAEVRRALGMHATADECGGCGCIATSVVNKAVQAIADRDVLAMEVLAWRGHVEDTHDRNYGFCRPGCTKCESKTKAWEIAKATDASGALGRAGG